MNTSLIDGDEVAELYLTPPPTKVSPRIALEGFQRIHLAAGEKRDVIFQLDPRQMSEVDAAWNPRELSGDYSIFVGGSQPGVNANNIVRVQVKGEINLPR